MNINKNINKIFSPAEYYKCYKYYDIDERRLLSILQYLFQNKYNHDIRNKNLFHISHYSQNYYMACSPVNILLSVGNKISS